MSAATAPDYRWLDRELDAIEGKIKELDGTMRILLAGRLVEDGHAPDFGTAMRMVRRNLAAVAALYVEPDDD